MKSDVENKLNKIADIWNHFIWEYKFCNKKIKFSEDVQSNYFGDILGYFQDTFDVVFAERPLETYTDRFAYNISLLQAIYIHQDFIEELLLIFKCGITKGHLKNDLNYAINRDIRNELIGHPIRKIEIPINDSKRLKCKSCGNFLEKPKNKSVLLSSTLFGYDSDKSSILYLRYHKDNNYQYETKSFKISEIIERHRVFLNTYFNIILLRLKGILTQYGKEIDKLQKLINNNDFETVVKFAGITYESIFKYDYIYDKDTLIEIYKRRTEHIRYQNLIDKFYEDLNICLVGTKRYIKELFEPEKVNEYEKFEKPIIDIIFTKSNDITQINKPKIKEAYHYELGKLASKRNPMDFKFFSGILKSECSKNKLVLNELNHMEANIYNEIEYYTAFRLIYSELNK